VPDHPQPVLAQSLVGAFATVSVPLTDIASLRPKCALPGAKPVASKFLKNADEQSVAAISALFRAIRNAGWEDRSFHDWGVIGVPRFLGRIGVAYNTSQYLRDPSYSVSPHIIPNQSLHSLSGTASLALSLHGPNFGVGGGPNSISEGLLAALSVLSDRSLSGLWVLLTEFDPEPQPDDKGQVTNPVTCFAVAIAFVSTELVPGTLQLISDQTPATAPVKLSSLIKFLTVGGRNGEPWRCPVPGIGALVLTLA
jgi:hypothetical protein